MPVVRVSARGQLVIPKVMHEAMGLVKGTRCRVDRVGDSIVLEPLGLGEQATWRRWEGRLKGTGALKAHVEEHRREVSLDARGL